MKIPIDKFFNPYWLDRKSSDTYPKASVSRKTDGTATLDVPLFVTASMVEQEDPETKLKTKKPQYTYYQATIPYQGEDVSNLMVIKATRWADLRAFFYGPSAVQNEMSVKGTLIGHQLAVRALFPKEPGADLPEDMVKFNETYTKFWTLISKTCQQFRIPYEAIPAYFDSSYMLQMAEQYSIPADALSLLVSTIQLIVDDLFSNGRRWKELMPKPSSMDLVSLLG